MQSIVNARSYLAKGVTHDPRQRGQELHDAVAEEGDGAGAGHGAEAVHLREPADHHRGAHVADGGPRRTAWTRW